MIEYSFAFALFVKYFMCRRFKTGLKTGLSREKKK